MAIRYTSVGLSRCLKCFLLTIMFLWSPASYAGDWEIGTGIADITGPVTGTELLGYGGGNVARGVQTRLWSRAFIIRKPGTDNYIVMVNTDLHSMSHGIKQGVLEKLRKGGMGQYKNDNVMLMATHTHTGPGGFHHHRLLNAATAGYDPDNYDKIVNGIVLSIGKANMNMTSGDVYLKRGELWNANINRNPTAYDQNPDKVNYTNNNPLYSNFPNNVDKRMTLLKFKADNGEDLGALNWFSVHNVSLTDRQNQVSGDNKGIASQFFEKTMGTNYKLNKTFVAAFANSLLGDASPSVCGSRDGCKSTDAAGAAYSAQKQFDKARDLFEGAVETDKLKGKLDYRHAFQSLPGYDVLPVYSANGQSTPVCGIRFGKSFSAGSTYDGFEGFGGNTEGMRLPEPVTNEDRARKAGNCHFPKPTFWFGPITGDGNIAGEAHNAYSRIVPFQLMTIGKLAIVSVAGEMTTMAGRRLENDMLAKLSGYGIMQVVITGPTNSYHGYVTTHEEYQMQRYEAAHNVFGPNTLGAYRQIYGGIAEALSAGRSAQTQEAPPSLRYNQGLISANMIGPDWLPLGAAWFGEIRTKPDDIYKTGETVFASFRSARTDGKNAKNGAERGFLEVQRYTNGRWVKHVTENDLSTTFIWYRARGSGCGFCATAELKWTPDETTPTGYYRLVHKGTAVDSLFSIKRFEGTTNGFFVWSPKDTVAIKAPSGSYFRAMNNGGGFVDAGGAAVNAWETLDVIKYEEDLPIIQTGQCIRNGDVIGFRTSAGYFLSSDPNKSQLQANQRHFKEWERFTFINHNGNACWQSGDKISLKTYHNKYLLALWGSVQSSASAPNSGNHLTLEILSPVKLDRKLSLKSAHGRYLTAENAGGGRALDIAGPVKAKQTFDVYLHDTTAGPLCIKNGSKISLRANWGPYFQANGNAGTTNMLSEKAEASATYTVNIEQRHSTTPSSGCVLDHDRISLKAFNNKYVVAEPGGIVNANRARVGHWERWELKFN